MSSWVKCIFGRGPVRGPLYAERLGSSARPMMCPFGATSGLVSYSSTSSARASVHSNATPIAPFRRRRDSRLNASSTDWPIEASFRLPGFNDRRPLAAANAIPPRARRGLFCGIPFPGARTSPFPFQPGSSGLATLRSSECLPSSCVSSSSQCWLVAAPFQVAGMQNVQSLKWRSFCKASHCDLQISYRGPSDSRSLRVVTEEDTLPSPLFPQQFLKSAILVDNVNRPPT